MRIDTRRLAVLAVAALAALAAVFAIRTLTGLMPKPGPTDTGSVDPATPPDAASEEAQASPGLKGTAAPEAVAPVPALPPPVNLDTCDRDLDLFGVVVTQDGTPVAGAGLRTVTYPIRRANLLDYSSYFRAVEGPGTRSASDGTFSIRLRRGQHVALRVSAPGFAPLERAECTAGQRLRIVLGPGVTLLVTLRDEAGNAVPDTSVRLFRSAHWGDVAFERRETTDAEGRARFTDLPGSVWAYIDPEPTSLGKVMWKRVDLPGAGGITADVVLPTGRTITGRVTDADTRAPIPGARVGINWTLDRAVTTDADGRYALTGWNDHQGANDVHVVAEGYGREGIVVGSESVVDFRLLRADSVVGRAVDGGGKPVPGAIVGVVASGPTAGVKGGDICGTTTTTEDGRFRVTSLKRDQRHAVVLMAVGFGRVVLDFLPHGDRPGEIDLGDVTLPPARAIEGLVLDGQGAPVAGVGVGLSGANADRGRLLGPDAPASDSWYGQTEETRTDDLGRFRFPDLSAGEYRLTASPDRGERVSRSVSLKPDADVLDVELVLATTREVVVRVRTADGSPIAGAYVSANIVNRRVGAQTAADGDARLALTADAWTIQVYVPESAAPGRPGAGPFLRVQPKPLSTTEIEVTFVLEPAAPITGFVRDAAGAAVEGAVVEAVLGERAVDTCAAGADGAFRVLVPAGSRVNLRVARRQQQHSRPGGAMSISMSDWSGGLPGVEAGATGVEIRARPTESDASIVVRVVDPAGAPVGGAGVSARAEGCSEFETTSAEGTAILRVSSAFRYTLFVSPRDAAGERFCAERLAEVLPDGKPLMVRLREGTPLLGKVVAPDGKPSPAAAVQAYLAGGKWVRFTRTDALGRFRIALDARLDYPLVLRAHGPAEIAGSEGSLDLPAAPTADVEIRLGQVAR